MTSRSCSSWKMTREPGSAPKWQALSQVLYTGVLYTAITFSWWSLSVRGSVASNRWQGHRDDRLDYRQHWEIWSHHSAVRTHQENEGNTTFMTLS